MREKEMKSSIDQTELLSRVKESFSKFEDLRGFL
jgi:hypothetical protein